MRRLNGSQQTECQSASGKQLEMELRLAWEWFQYHASQRFAAFNFFLVLMGAVIVGYSQAVVHGSQALAIPLGIFGWLVAVAFWAMDVRNDELVNCGRAALDLLESKLAIQVRCDDNARAHLEKALDDRIQRCVFKWVKATSQRAGPAGEEGCVGKTIDDRANPRTLWFTHRRLLRLVIFVFGAMSLAGAIGAGIWL